MLKIVSKKEYEKLLEWKERYEEKEQELLMVKKGFEIYKEDVEKKKKLETRKILVSCFLFLVFRKICEFLRL